MGKHLNYYLNPKSTSSMKLTLTSFLVATFIVGYHADQQCQCGIEGAHNKITNGRDAKPNKYPWMIFISAVKPKGTMACGGTIINDRFVMTAAHCVTETTEKLVRIHLTDKRPSSTHIRFGIGSIGVKKIHIHSEYEHFGKNDIALLEIIGRFEFKNDFGPVCLPSFTEINDQTDLTAIGWGTIDPFTMELRLKLQEAELEYVPMERCKSTLQMNTHESVFELN